MEKTIENKNKIKKYIKGQITPSRRYTARRSFLKYSTIIDTQKNEVR